MPAARRASEPTSAGASRSRRRPLPRPPCRAGAVLARGPFVRPSLGGPRASGAPRGRTGPTRSRCPNAGRRRVDSRGSTCARASRASGARRPSDATGCGPARARAAASPTRKSSRRGTVGSASARGAAMPTSSTVRPSCELLQQVRGDRAPFVRESKPDGQSKSERRETRWGAPTANTRVVAHRANSEGSQAMREALTRPSRLSDKPRAEVGGLPSLSSPSTLSGAFARSPSSAPLRSARRAANRLALS